MNDTAKTAKAPQIPGSAGVAQISRGTAHELTMTRNHSSHSALTRRSESHPVCRARQFRDPWISKVLDVRTWRATHHHSPRRKGSSPREQHLAMQARSMTRDAKHNRLKSWQKEALATIL